MKNTMLALITLLSTQAFADNVKTVVLSQRTVDVPITINRQLLKLSRADYSVPTVKILVPALADITIMNHRNFREGAPCLATDGTKKPSDVIQNREGDEVVPMTVTLSKQLYKKADNTCEVFLLETVETNIRGYVFSHERAQEMPLRQLEDCR